jgi:hypothetical protein
LIARTRSVAAATRSSEAQLRDDSAELRMRFCAISLLDGISV